MTERRKPQPVYPEPEVLPREMGTAFVRLREWNQVKADLAAERIENARLREAITVYLAQEDADRSDWDAPADIEALRAALEGDHD